MLLHGPAGSGKTYIARSLSRLLPGPVAVPYAISVQDEVIRVFDPLCHHPLEPAPAPAVPRGQPRQPPSRRRPLGAVRTPRRRLRRRADAGDAGPGLRSARRLLRGAAAPEGQQRPVHRRRPGPPARHAARADEPLDRADGAPPRPPHAAPGRALHRALRDDAGVLVQPVAARPGRRLPAPHRPQDRDRPGTRRSLCAASSRAPAPRKACPSTPRA